MSHRLAWLARVPLRTQRTVSRTLVPALMTLAASACLGSQGMSAQTPPLAPPGVVADTLDPRYVPIGFGTLRQDDIALKFAQANGLQVRAVPLEERMLRLLSPDSYRSLRELLRSKSKEINAVFDRTRLPSYSIWYVSFNALEQGETRFSPQELVINNIGRDFRPIDVLPLTAGFGEYRLKQRGVQSALMIFDGQIDLNQALTGNMEGTPTSTDWRQVVERTDRERALIRSRAAAAAKQPGSPSPIEQ